MKQNRLGILESWRPDSRNRRLLQRNDSPPIRCGEYFQIPFCWFLSCDMVKGGHRTRLPQRLELRCVLGEERPGKP